MNMNSQTLKPTATATATAQVMRAIHIRPEGECSCGHNHSGGISALAALLGIQTKSKPEPARNGGLTIAYQVDPLNNLINVGFSLCRQDEPYSRTLGYTTSKERIATKDKVYSFSLNTTDVVAYVLGICKQQKELGAFNGAFIKTIRFEDLSTAAIEHTIAQACGVRIHEIKLRAAEELAEVKNEQQKRQAARKADKAQASAAAEAEKVQAAGLMAKTLVQTDQVPPMQ